LLGAGEDVAESGEVILGKIESRAYSDYGEFRADFTAFLEAISTRNFDQASFAPAKSAWMEALEWLRGDYWTRFQFDAESELAAYSE
jgi:hypothetical protein